MLLFIEARPQKVEIVAFTYVLNLPSLRDFRKHGNL